MQNIISRLENLSKSSKFITLYRNFDKVVVMKNIGKIPGEVDKQYFEFLKLTNGASVLDYCFLGLKNRKLGRNLYDNITDFWQLDNMLALRFWAFSGNSYGESFGYLDKINVNGDHYIGFYSRHNPEHVFYVASSFKIFMNKFLDKIEKAILANNNEIIIDDNEWFLSLDKLIYNDYEMKDELKNAKNTEYDLFKF